MLEQHSSKVQFKKADQKAGLLLQKFKLSIINFKVIAIFTFYLNDFYNDEPPATQWLTYENVEEIRSSLLSHNPSVKYHPTLVSEA